MATCNTVVIRPSLLPKLIIADDIGGHFVFIEHYASKCSTSMQIPHIQTVLTKHTEAAALGHKM